MFALPTQPSPLRARGNDYALLRMVNVGLRRRRPRRWFDEAQPERDNKLPNFQPAADWYTQRAHYVKPPLKPAVKFTPSAKGGAKSSAKLGNLKPMRPTMMVGKPRRPEDEYNFG